jgi:hypothetical protein
MKFKIKRKTPFPGLIYLKFQNQYELCSSFMRMQEFYESPFKQVRGKFFTLEKFMDLYARQQGNFTYTTDWGGFNVPGHVVNAFHDHFREHLLEKEKRLFEAIWKVEPDARYYVIGLSDDSNLDHEMAHALYYLNDDYCKTVQSLVKSLPASVSKPVKRWLLKHGYSKPLVVDETNAYLATNNKAEITDIFGKKVGKHYKKFKPFRKAFKEHKDQMK